MTIPLIKNGETVVLSYGEYSDYGFSTVVTAKKDFNVTELAKMFCEDKGLIEWHCDYYKDGKVISKYDHDFPDFEAWLINESGLVEETAYRELHIGSYSDINPKAYK